RNAVPLAGLHAEYGLDPDGDWMLGEFRIGGVLVDGLRYRCRELAANGVGMTLRVGAALETLRDDMARVDLAVEEFRRDRCHRDLRTIVARHRGRRADALQPARCKPTAQAAHQHRHVRTLAAAVGVELVENQGGEPLAV